MKATACLLIAFAIVTLSSGAEPAGLEVHEWGTFTVVAGSDGIPLRWWQPASAPPAELPPFVERNFTAWKSAPWLVRMETPVLYFYPDAPMAVEVTAQLRQGRITEWFPVPASLQAPSATLMPADFVSQRVVWKGELLPASDPGAAARLPKTEGAAGAVYGAAREVPEAWFFQSHPTGKAAQIEKFIFYRGAGDDVPPYQASARADGTVQMLNVDAAPPVQAAFVVRTVAGQTHWAALPAQPQGGVVSVKVGEGTHAADLGTTMTEALTAAGLTRPEAEAMVGTWSGHWFSEPGTRVLAILPQPWVDRVLPLAIKPAPRKTVRVFVARLEVLTPDKEEAFLTLLSKPQADTARLADLALGRFAPAAFVRAQNLMTQRLQQRFADLSAAAAR